MTTLDLRRFTMADAASLLGYPKPAAHRCTYAFTGAYEDGEGVIRCEGCGDETTDSTITPPEGTCRNCGGLLVWADEVRGYVNSPNATGYTVEVCEDCDAQTGRRERVGW